jgi:hypothetical protein
MNKLYIFDFIISSFLAGINIYYVKDFRILIGLLWSFFILCSVLLNYNQILYFASLYIIGMCIVAIYILKKIPFTPEYNIIFWILYLISACVLISIIISKKLLLNNIGTMPLTGDKGITGKIGNPGISYNLKTYPEKGYDELITVVETYITQNKVGNNIEHDKNDYQLKNLYFKDLLKNICLSHEFGNYIHGINTSKICEYDDKLGKRVLNGTNIPCNKNTVTKELNNDINIRYKIIITHIKKVVIGWIKEFLKNNSYETKKLLTKLGYPDNTDINNVYVLEDNKYNNKVGHTFLKDPFYNETYFEQHIIKKNNVNPFDNIKMKKSNEFKILELGNPYYWGKNYNKCN